MKSRQALGGAADESLQSKQLGYLPVLRSVGLCQASALTSCVDVCRQRKHSAESASFWMLAVCPRALGHALYRRDLPTATPSTNRYTLYHPATRACVQIGMRALRLSYSPTLRLSDYQHAASALRVARPSTCGGGGKPAAKLHTNTAGRLAPGCIGSLC